MRFVFLTEAKRIVKEILQENAIFF